MEIILKDKHLNKLSQIMGEMPYKYAKHIEIILADAEKDMKEENKKEGE